MDTSDGETQQVRKESDVIADVPGWMLAIVVVAQITLERKCASKLRRGEGVGDQGIRALRRGR